MHLGVQETPGNVPLENRLALMEAVGPEDAACLSDQQVCESKHGTEAKPKRQTSIGYMLQQELKLACNGGDATVVI